MSDSGAQLLVGAIFLGVAAVGSAAIEYLCVEPVTFRVHNTETFNRTHTSSSTDSEGNVSVSITNETVHRVYTDGETFENHDSLWHWKWNSESMQGRFAQGVDCTATAVGFRLGDTDFFTRNLINVECTEPVFNDDILERLPAPSRN